LRQAAASDSAASRAQLLSALTAGPSDEKGRYLHWTDLRHKVPPKGLDRQLWWAGTRNARRHVGVDLPLNGFGDEPFWFCPHNVMLSRLHWADINAAGAMSGEPALADPASRRRYLMRNLVEEAISSSQLEGASTTTAVARTMIASGRAPDDRDERMILNNYRAMQFIRSVRGEPLSLDVVFELHRIATEGTFERPDHAGRLRTAADAAVVVEDRRTQDTVHVPPRVDQLESRLRELVAFAHGDPSTSSVFIHPLVRAIALHFMIGWIHPFIDGNGRTARALFYWSASRSDYGMIEYLSISAALKRAPIAYLHAYLRTETDGNDLTYFIDHQLDVLAASIAHLQEAFQQRIAETRRSRALLEGNGTLRSHLNLRQTLLLQHALDHPHDAITIATHMARHQVTHQTARKDLVDLVEKFQLLDKHTEGRRFVFTAPADLTKRMARCR